MKSMEHGLEKRVRAQLCSLRYDIYLHIIMAPIFIGTNFVLPRVGAYSLLAGTRVCYDVTSDVRLCYVFVMMTNL